MRESQVIAMKMDMKIGKEYEVPIEYNDSTGNHIRYEKAILIEKHRWIATFRMQKNQQILSFRYEDLYRHGEGKYRSQEPIPPFHKMVFAADIDAKKAAEWLDRGFTLHQVSDWMGCSEVTMRKALRMNGLYKPLEPRRYKAWHKGQSESTKKTSKSGSKRRKGKKDA